MSNRLFFIAFSLLFWHQTNAQDLPNILWIVSEDNSPFLGCYGDAFATTPNLDKLASQGILYQNAFSTAPVCAPSRSTLITGMYPPSIGTEHMRSTYPVPDFVHFFPKYLREAGYYTTNNAKKDYNTVDQEDAWDESSNTATYKNRKNNQPFFAIFNLNVSHESSIHKKTPLSDLKHDPEKVALPPYHPHTPEMKHDWAQYYDKVQEMDAQAGQLIAELEEAGLAENTIIFYYADNGGILGRSKRFVYESGLRVPLIIRFPEKYKHLAKESAGSKTDRLVTFLDFAPTVLSLTGIKIPEYLQGKAFLGLQQQKENEYAFGFRGRMDERTDLSRTVRNKKFRYIRNYLPHKIYAQYLEYLWQAPSMKSWEREYKAGNLNEIQRRFWEEKPAEELFDIENDPHNINNLANDPKYKNELVRLRKANIDWLEQSKDIGFIPEGMVADIAENISPLEYARSGQYDAKKVISFAEIASSRDESRLKEIIRHLNNSDPILRYWAITGIIILKSNDSSIKPQLEKLLNDPVLTVRIAAAEALIQQGEFDKSVETLSESLKSNNVMARVHALNILENLGDKARPAYPNIQALIKDKQLDRDYDIRAARKILNQGK